MKKVFVLYLLFSVIGCKKEMDELSKLPPATQIGADTFGCLVNGIAWLPDNGCTLLCPRDLKFYYSGEYGGNFSVLAILNVNQKDQRVAFGFYPCAGIGIKNLLNFDTTSIASFADYKKIPWEIISSKDLYVGVVGKITITRFDLVNGIISGEFEYTLTKPGYETINITNGRFDAKF